MKTKLILSLALRLWTAAAVLATSLGVGWTQTPSIDDFNPMLGGGDYYGAGVYALAVQPDGKILVGGDFSVMGDSRRECIGRLNADGAVDIGFNSDANGSVYSLALQADGKILVGGSFTNLGGQARCYLGRLNADGTVDIGFNSDANGNVYSLALQADGKILVGGEFSKLDNQPRNCIGRLNADGSVDSGFNPGASGWKVNEIEASWVETLVVQADGKILVGGGFTILGGSACSCLGRLNSDGTLDIGFNSDANGGVYSLALQADGKILVGGEFSKLDNQPRNCIGRLNADGSVDSGFTLGVGGTQYPYVTALAVQADGKVLVGGYFFTLGEQSRTRIGRINADGTLDGTFNRGASGGAHSDGEVHCLALQTDGRILVGGQFDYLGIRYVDGVFRRYLGRLNNTEAATQNLSYDGSTIIWLRGGTGPEVWRTTFDISTNGSDWEFLGAGSRFAGGWQLPGVSVPLKSMIRARGDVSGEDDASGWFTEAYYGSPVIVSQPVSRTNDAGTTATFTVLANGSDALTYHYQWCKEGVPLTDGGKLGGATTAVLNLTNALGADAGGYFVVVSNNWGCRTSAVATLATIDPLIISPPTNQYPNAGESATLTLSVVGTAPFGYQWLKEGIAVAQGTMPSLVMSNLQSADAGNYSVVVSNQFGNATSAVAMVTVNLATTEADFNPGSLEDVYDTARVNCLAAQADGKTLVGGEFVSMGGQARSNLIRLNTDGDLDTGFNPGVGGTGYPELYCLAIQADGKILVGGTFTVAGGLPRTNLARLNVDGTLDSGFNPAPNSPVQCLVVQADGRILVGGSFTNLSGVMRNCIGRLNADGTVDTGFNPGLEGPSLSASVYSMAVQPDGKILLGGTLTTVGGQLRTNLARLNGDGTLDSSFNPGANSSVLCIAVQADGQILVGGDFTTLGGQARNYLGRLKRDGTLDDRFNPGANGYVYSLALQTDAKILIGGGFTSLEGRLRKYLGRVDSDGIIDNEFNPGVGDAYGNYPCVYSLTVQKDGRILVGGEFSTLGGQPRKSIGRLKNTAPATGSLGYDGSTVTWLRGGSSPEVWRTSFEVSTNGRDWEILGEGLRSPAGWQLSSVSIPPNGMVRARGYVAGGTYNASGWFVEAYCGRPVLVVQPASRTNDAGNTAAFSVLASSSEPLNFQWLKEGSPLVDGGNLAGAWTSVLRLTNVMGSDAGGYSVVVSNASGSVTSTVATLTVVEPFIISQPTNMLGNAGESVTFSLSAAGTALSYQWWKDGLLLDHATGPSLTLINLQSVDAGGYSVVVRSLYGSVTSAVAQLTVNLATADLLFNPGANGPLAGPPVATSLALQADGMILAGGSFTNVGGLGRNRIARLNADGTLDTTFNPGVEGTSLNASIYSLAVQPDGKILLGGNFSMVAGQLRTNLARLNMSGTVDSGFNPVANSYVYSLTVQQDGKILVGGAFTAVGGQMRAHLARLNADGAVDAGFSLGANGTVYSMAVQPDGKILVGGTFTTVGGQFCTNLARLNVDGTLDIGFKPRVSSTVYSVAVQPDGKVLVGGNFTTVGGQSCNRIGRLNADGTLDAGFNPGANNIVYSLAMQADGQVLVGGSFTTLGGQLCNRIGRLNADGTVDSAFNPGVFGLGAGAWSFAVQADGNVLVGGRFTNLAGQARNNIGRLYNTEPASQNLRYDGSTITWLRGGSSPEVWRTTFEVCTNGIDWVSLGGGTRIQGAGWQLAGVPLASIGTIRARGYVAGGCYNGSGWFVESTWSFGPDLRVASLDSPLHAVAGTVQPVSWTLINSGHYPVTNDWVDRVYLCTNPIAGNGRLMGEFASSGTLSTNQPLTRFQSILLPSDLEPNRDYWWMVVTDAGNAVKEESEANNTWASDQPMRLLGALAPNLRVFSVSASASPMSGQPVTVTWAVTNAGSWATGAGLWQDAMYLSATTNLDDTALLLGRATRPRPLGPSESYSGSLTANLPQGFSGNRYFIVHTDVDNRVNEGLFEDDNTTASVAVTVTLTPPPDLKVAAIQTPSSTLSGTSLDVSWTVTNAGPGATAEAVWYDDLYLSSHATFDTNATLMGSFLHEGLLTNGGWYEASSSIILPTSFSGNYFLFVQTDSRSNVFEDVFETNNITVTPNLIAVSLTPPPDLALAPVTAPSKALASHTLSLGYTVTNQGPNSALDFWWEDRLYLSTDPKVGREALNALPSGPLGTSGPIILLAGATHFGGLPAGESYHNTIEVTLPDGLSGPWHVIVVADSTDEVFELDKTNNLRGSAAPVLIESRPAALVVTALSAPSSAQAGASLLVSWNVRNQGSGDTAVSRWTDRLVLSSDPIVGNADDVMLLTLEHDGVLLAGGGYSVSNQVVSVPFSVAPGSYRLFLLTDSGNAVYEGTNEGNNASAPSTLSVNRQTADLRVAAVTLSDPGGQGGWVSNALSEDTLLVSWRVENNGVAAPNSSAWSDAVYLSTNSVLDTNAFLIGTHQNPTSLAPGAFYTNSLAVTLPAEIQGRFFLHVQTDSEGLMVEDNKANNSLPATNMLQVTLRPVPDLAVISVATPADGFSGQLFELSWIVTNSGSALADGTWFDSVYLSLDSQFEPEFDTYIGYAERPTVLANGQNYIQTAVLEIPPEVSGLFYVFVVCDATHRLNERGATTNNVGRAATPLSVWLQPPADLVVGTINIPSNAVAGYEMALTYTLHNQGTNAAFGPWADAVYLSADDQWDIGDTLLTRVSQGGFLVAGGSRTNTVRAPAPGVVPGNYHVIIRTDIVNQVPETNEFNNITATLNQTAAEVEELALDIPAANSLATRQARYYRVHVSSGQWLVIELNCASSTASTQLFVRHGAIPTRSEFDFIHSNPLQPNHRIVVPNTREGDYYILAYGDMIPAPGIAGTTLAARLSPFLVFEKSFGKGGNAGNLTISLSGVDFDRTCTVRLTNAAGLDRPALAHYYESSTRFYATLDLRGLAPGTYTVTVQNEESGTVPIPNSLEVVESGPPPSVIPALSMPNSVRRGVAYTFSVQWANNGLNDLPAPLLTVGNTVPFGLSPNNYSLGLRYTFLGINTHGGPPGILRPGQYEIMTFHAFSGAEPGTHTAFADREGKNRKLPFDWSTVRDSARALELTEQQFCCIFSVFAELRPTWGDYLDLLSVTANSLAPTSAEARLPEALVRRAFTQSLTNYTPYIAGQVLDFKGKPMGGICITAQDTNSNASFSATSEDDGTFVIAPLPPSRYSLIPPKTWSFSPAPTVLDLQAGIPIPSLRLSLDPGVAVRGTVRRGGIGSEQAALVILLKDGSVVSANLTDNEGRYDLHGPRQGNYQLWASQRDSAPAWIETNLVGEISLDFSLVQGAVMTGRISHSDGGDSNGALVQLIPLHAALFDQITIMPRGETFSISNVPQGEYTVTISQSGYTTAVSPLVSINQNQMLDLGVMELIRTSSLKNPKAPTEDGEVPAFCFPKIVLQSMIKAGMLIPDWEGINNDLVDLYEAYFSDELKCQRMKHFTSGTRAAADFADDPVINARANEAFEAVKSALLEKYRDYIGTCTHEEKRESVDIGSLTLADPTILGVSGESSDEKAKRAWTFSGNRVPGLAAGGVGSGGPPPSCAKPINDSRRLFGRALVRLPKNSGTLHFYVDMFGEVIDTLDFSGPSDRYYAPPIAIPIPVPITYPDDAFPPLNLPLPNWLEPLNADGTQGDFLNILHCLSQLESNDQAFDVPFMVTFFIKRYTATEQVNPECNECARPDPPDSCKDTKRPASWDPNDIMGPCGFGTDRWISPEQVFHYTVRFENDAKKAEAPAQYVRITQQLSTNLDLRTFRLGVMGFGTNLVNVPADRAFFQTQMNVTNELGVVVEVVAGLDLGKGEVTWEFTSIDPAIGDLPWDPYVGFLPPNTNGTVGQGFVTYSIKPKAGIASGDIVNAEARIFFDANEPIDTPRIFNTMDGNLPSSSVLPLPAFTNLNTFPVRWAGADGYGGAGIRGFDVYISDDNGPWRVWLADSAQTESIFVGECGHTYAFYSVGRDNVGNQEIAVAAAQASIYVLPNTAPVLAPIPSQVVAVGQQLTITNVASDPDTPSQLLSFTLDPGAPFGMNIDVGNGLLSWVPGGDQVNTTNFVTIRVNDDGCGTLSSTQRFSVVVSPSVPPQLTAGWTEASLPFLTLQGTPGVSYVIESTTNLQDAAWKAVQGGTLTNSQQIFDGLPSGSPAIFYRAREGKFNGTLLKR